MPLTPLTNDGSSHVLINNIDADCQITDFSSAFAAQEIMSVVLCNEESPEGTKGTQRHVVGFTIKAMTGQDALPGYLASLPFGVACVWTYTADAEITGDYNIPQFTLPKVAGAALNFGSGVAASTGPYVISWPDGTVTS
jgi:hypothetical protein